MTGREGLSKRTLPCPILLIYWGPPVSKAAALFLRVGHLSSTPGTGYDSDTLTGANAGFADRVLSKLENALNMVAAASIFLLMIIATVQVLGRKLLNWPVPGYIDIAEQSIAVFAFLAVAYCQRLGGHVRMELVLDKFRGRPLWLAEAIQTAATLVLIAVLAWFAYGHFERALGVRRQHDRHRIADVALQTHGPIAFAVLFVRLGIQLVGFIRLVARPDAVPVAVPLIIDVEADGARGERRRRL